MSETLEQEGFDSLSDALDALEFAQKDYKQKDAAAKAAKKEYDRLSIEVVPKIMEEHGLDSVTRGDKLIYTREDMYASVPSEYRGVFAEELREMGEDAIITEYVFPQTLSSWVRDRLEDGQPIPSQIEIRRVKRAVPRNK